MPRNFSSLLAALSCTALIALPAAGQTQEGKSPAMKRADRQAEQVSSSEVLYTVLLSEIAVARGALTEAAASYLDLARKTGDPRLARRATEIAVASRQIALASAAAQAWVAADPDSEPALQTLVAVLASGASQPDALEAALRKLLDRVGTRRPELFTLLPQAFARVADKQAVRAAIERLTEADLALAEARYARALAALFVDDRATAERLAQEALQMRPDWEAAALLRARVAPPESQAAAMEELRAFGRRNPSALESRLTYARWLVKEGRVDDARTYYAGLLSEFPANSELAYKVMPIAVQNQDLPTAETILRGLVAKESRDLNLVHLQLGEVLETQGKSSEAKEQYRAVAGGEHLAAARIRLARVLANEGDLAGALTILHDDAVSRPADKVLLLRTEADLLRRANQTDAAYAVLDQALTLQPDDADILYDSALFAERLKKYAVMEQRLRRLIHLNPDYAHAYNALGYSFADRNINLAEADTLLQAALKLAPEDAAILDSVGWLRFRQGRLTQATEYLRKAYDQLKDPEVAAHLSQVLWQDGRFAAARRLLEEASTANPDSAILNTLKPRFGM